MLAGWLARLLVALSLITLTQLQGRKTTPACRATIDRLLFFRILSSCRVVSCRIVRVVSFLIFCWGTASDGRDSRRGSSASQYPEEQHAAIIGAERYLTSLGGGSSPPQLMAMDYFAHLSRLLVPPSKSTCILRIAPESH
ncbi:hypothetical protein BJ166DRAFT_495217 [Pestalotiopsis sp. NC0098]|nr:hypothetical protein BJ166DRAFT_495217 [Pestalotiopsis sp. NC0098]